MAVKSDWFITYKKMTASFKPFQSGQEAREYCDRLYGGSEKYHIALSQWISVSLIEAEKARNAKEAKIAYVNAPAKSDACTLARDKWDEYSIIEARHASTIEEAEAAYSVARSGVKAAEVAFSRWSQLWYAQTELVKTVAECKSALEQAPVRYSGDTSSKDFALSKWNALVLPMVKRARTYKRACIVYELCPPNSEAQKLIIQKVNSLYTGEKNHGENALYLMDRAVIEFLNGEERSSISTWGKLKKRLKKEGKN